MRQTKAHTVNSQIKAAPDYKPLPIIGRTKLPNLYNISRSLLQAASPQWEKSADFCSYLSKKLADFAHMKQQCNIFLII